MKRNTVTGEVILNDREFPVTSMRDLFVSQGTDSVVEAARAALDTFKGKPSKPFVEWLSEGGLTKDGDEIVDVQPAEPEPAAASGS